MGQKREMGDSEKIQCKRMKAATAAAITTITRTMYLFVASHDCDGSSPALKTKSGDDISEAASAGFNATSSLVEVAATAGVLDRRSTSSDCVGVGGPRQASDVGEPIKALAHFATELAQPLLLDAMAGL